VDEEEPGEGERLSFAIIDVEEDGTGPDMGDWDAPFELSRAIDEPEDEEPAPPKRQMKTTVREIPLDELRGEPPAAEDEEDVDVAEETAADVESDLEESAEEEDADTLLLVDEDDWEEAGSALEDAIEEDAVTQEGPIIEERPAKVSPIVMTRNVILGREADKDVIPPQPMTQRKAVDEIIQHRFRAEEKAATGKPAGKPTLSPLRKMKKAGRVDESAVKAWLGAVERMETRDEVLDATLSLMDRTFGPSIFLARKGKNLAGWNCSRSFWAGMSGDLHSIVIGPPTPREVWHSLERKRGMMGPVAVMAEYPFLETLFEEEKPSILVLPVVMRNIAAGAFLCVLRDRWTASPSLRDTLERIGRVLSEKLEQILKRKKGNR
jgi:hypothetical protein